MRIKCPTCGKKFWKCKQHRKFCSRECRFAAYTSRRERGQCALCGKQIPETRSIVAKYCCEECARQAKNMTREQRRKGGLPVAMMKERMHERGTTCYRNGKRCRHYDGGCFTDDGLWRPQCAGGKKYEPESSSIADPEIYSTMRRACEIV